MKRWLAVCLLFISLVFLLSFSIADEQPHIYLSVSCDSNWIFSRYDVEIYLDSQKISTLTHGQKASYDIATTAGSHTIWFYKPDDHKVNGSIEVYFQNDIDISCKVHCTSGRVEVKDQSAIVRPTPEPTPAPQYKILLDRTDYVVNKGESQTVNVKIENLPDNFIPQYQWISGDSGIVSCSDGVILGEQAGRTTITCIATIPDGTELSEKLNVLVYVPVDSVDTDEKELSLNIGRSYTPSFVVLPDDASEKRLVFSSSDQYVATVNSEGIITANGAGKVIITATAVDDSNKSVSISIEVIDNRGSLGNNINTLAGASTGIVCSTINEQLANLNVLFRRPGLPAFLVELTARQLFKTNDELNFEIIPSEGKTAAFVGLSVNNPDELYMAIQNSNGLFLLVSVNANKKTISYSRDTIEYQDAEAFIKESSNTYVEVTSQEISQVKDAVDSLEESPAY